MTCASRLPIAAMASARPELRLIFKGRCEILVNRLDASALMITALKHQSSHCILYVRET